MKNKKNLIGVIIVLLIIACVCFPDMLVFLNAHQREAVRLCVDRYLVDAQPIKDANGQFDFVKLLSILIVIAGCWAANYLVSLLFSVIKLKDRHAQTIKGLIGNLLKYAIVIYCIIYSLTILGLDVAAVLASLGILGLVIGFGAQSLIEDVITGLFIVLEGHIQVGDVIAIDDFRGTVTSIGIRTTALVDDGGNERIINNSAIKDMTNLSDKESIAAVIIGISYNADLVKAEKVVKETLEKLPSMYPEIFTGVCKYFGVDNLNSSSVDLKMGAYVNEKNIFAAKRLINREIKLAFDANGVEIPFPQVVVHKGE